MYSSVKIYQKSILIAVAFLAILLFCFILYKSYKISKIKENINDLPVIKSDIDIIKIKKETRELKIKTNSFYNNLEEESEDKVVIADDNISKDINNVDDTLSSKINNIVNENIINNNNNVDIQNNINNKDVVVNENIKTVIINEQSKDKTTENKENSNLKTNNNYYKSQLVALKNKQQAYNFVEKTKKLFSNMLKNLDVFVVEIDLGNKGIFYRVQVGNFNNKDDATNFCKEYLKITIKNPTNCIVVK